MAETPTTAEQLDAEWWDAWWAEDFSWAGLAARDQKGRPKHPWQGWFVEPDGSLRAKQGEVWPPAPATPSVSALQADPPSPPLAVGVSRPEGVKVGGEARQATLQDYWRRDTVTGAVRTDAELEAGGELVRDPTRNLWHMVHMPAALRGSGARAAYPPAEPKEARSGEPDVKREEAGAGNSARAIPGEGEGPRAGIHGGDGTKVGMGPGSPVAPRPAAGTTMGEGAMPAHGPTWKADLKHPDWERIEGLLAPRIASGRETKFRYSSVEGPDGRAQLQGAMLRRVAAHPSGRESLIHISSRLARYVGESDCRGWFFGPGADFQSASFQGHAVFSSASFEGAARFARSTFSKSVWFAGPGSGNDDRAAIFTGEADFNNATFEGAIRGAEVQFKGGATFRNTVFKAEVDLRRAAFGGETHFNRATFDREAQFEKAAFRGPTHFNRVGFAEDANFQSARFEGFAKFSHVKFAANAWFSTAIDMSDGAIFDTVSFEDARFEGGARFGDAVFNKKFGFEKAWFRDVADFKGCGAPTDEAGWRGAFTGATFEQQLDFRGREWRLASGKEGKGPPPQDERSTYHLFSAFDGAKLNRGVLWDRPDDKPAERTFQKGVLRPLRDLKGRAARDAALKALEGGAQKLKLAMESESDKKREQAFYRYELLARRRHSGTPWFEKLVSLLYGAVSNYGGGLWQPIVALLLFALAFGTGYWAWAAWLDLAMANNVRAPDWSLNDWGEAMLFSANNVFRPFNVWGMEEAADRSAWAQAFLSVSEAPGTRLGIRMVATLQSVLALLLGFLFALAVRRRFQIS